MYNESCRSLATWVRMIVFALVASFFPAVAKAETTGNKLHEFCNIPESSFEAICIVYIEGVMKAQNLGANVAFLTMFNMVVLEVSDETFQELKKLKRSDMLGYCIPEDVSLGQIKDVVKQYLDDNPQSRHEPAVLLIYRSVKAAFPCAVP